LPPHCRVQPWASC